LAGVRRRTAPSFAQHPELARGSCPAEAGGPLLLYAQTAGDSTIPEGAVRRVSFSELLGGLSYLVVISLKKASITALL